MGELPSEARGLLEVLRPVGERAVAHALPGRAEHVCKLRFSRHRPMKSRQDFGSVAQTENPGPAAILSPAAAP
jgi:hypothetical protein